MGIAAVSFKIENGVEIVIYPQGEWDAIDFDRFTFEEDTNMIVYQTKVDTIDVAISKLEIATSVDGTKILRLRETVAYTCRQRCGSVDEKRSVMQGVVFSK